MAGRDEIVAFCDQLLDKGSWEDYGPNGLQVPGRSEEIERRGLEAYSRENDGRIEESFETLLTGLAVRYYKAVAG